jgi:GntR family transcriptional regulator
MDLKNKSKDYESPYQRLQTELGRMIAGITAGDRLPAEPELAKQMGVSRATLREAMRTFEGQGLIRRRQGVGTFVVGQTPVLESGMELLESIETQSKRIHLDVSMGALHIDHISADEELAKAMDLPIGSDLVQIARVIMAEERPVAYLIDILPIDIIKPEELQNDFTGSVLDFLLQRGTNSLTKSLAEIRAVAAKSDIARALQIQRGDVLLMFQAKLFTVEGRMIDYSSSYFIPGYFRFQVIRRIGQLNH